MISYEYEHLTHCQNLLGCRSVKCQQNNYFTIAKNAAEECSVYKCCDTGFCVAFMPNFLMCVLGLTEGKTDSGGVLRSIIPHVLPESVKQAGSPLLEQTSQVFCFLTIDSIENHIFRISRSFKPQERAL